MEELWALHTASSLIKFYHCINFQTITFLSVWVMTKSEYFYTDDNKSNFKHRCVTKLSWLRFLRKKTDKQRNDMWVLTFHQDEVSCISLHFGSQISYVCWMTLAQYKSRSQTYSSFSASLRLILHQSKTESKLS